MENKVYTKKDIFESLEALGAPRDGVLLMHTSMRSIGRVEGGVTGLLDAMKEYFTSRGGLFLVPTHTWHNLDNPDATVTLDLASSDTCLGAFSNAAAADPRGYRTENPTHSVVIFGDRERALELAKFEGEIDTPIAPLGCYGRLSEVGGKILLVGVGQTKNTFIHSVEEMIGVGNRMESHATEYTVRRATGELLARKMRLFYTDYTPDISYRFHKYELALRYHGAIADGFIGNAPTELCDARKIEQTLRLIYSRSHGADPLADEEMLPPSLYVNRE